jgi:monomeric sarcosine oxidase
MRARSDFVVVGSGVFGAWIAHCLAQRNHSVTLVDAYGAGNSRSSSGDESRIIRMGYGADALYTRWAARSLDLWQQMFRATGTPLFVNTGMLWLASKKDTYVEQTLATLSAEGIPHEKLTAAEIGLRFPQFNLEDVEFGIFEPQSGVLLARRAVMAVVEDAVRLGVKHTIDAVLPPKASPGHLSALNTRNGETLTADTFVFACGAWLPKTFPALLATRLFPTRQEVFYFGPPAGSREFKPKAMPTWLHRGDEIYGMPDIENRGIKLANDRHGPPADPDNEVRLVSNAAEREARDYLHRRLPALKDAPVVETRVCQYENTCNGDFLLDRHPDWENVWLAGGGSGHGFKHGPAVGEYLAGRIFKEHPPEPRFSLSTKLEMQLRTVY